VLATTLGAALSLFAVLMRPLSIEELGGKADLIVQGVVTNKTCLRDEANRIYTKIEIQVIEVLKGRGVGGALTVEHGGGTIGDRRQEVSGQVEYIVGEEVLGFFVLNPRGRAVTIGLCQGKFDIWQDKQTGEKFAHNIFHGAPPPRSSPQQVPSNQPEVNELRVPLKLSDLKTQILEVNK
jgi:hypothetical protein